MSLSTYIHVNTQHVSRIYIHTLILVCFIHLGNIIILYTYVLYINYYNIALSSIIFKW